MTAIISIENLSKRYLVRHNAVRERYTSLRDVMADNAKRLVKNGLKILRGHEIAQSVEVEEFWALRDVSFDVNEGDVLGIIGRNGAGKSTLLKILSRITEPTVGRVCIRGRVASLLEVGTGFHPELTGRENIYLNGAILGMTRSEINRKFDEIVAFAEVERFIDTPVKRYSSGMYVRLAFSVAAHLEPEILVVDEVLAVGDASFQRKCLAKMKDVSRRSGQTILFVSHQLGVLSQLCHRAIVLKSGSVVCMGDPSVAISNYLAESEADSKYINSCPPTNKPFIGRLSLGGDFSQATEFCANEAMVVQAELNNLTDIQNVHLGIGIDDKFGGRVTTFVKRLDELRPHPPESNTMSLSLEITAGFIAPNTYSITAALFIPRGELFDSVSNVCPFRIIDNGTEMSIFEGMDYGSVLIPASWSTIARQVS